VFTHGRRLRRFFPDETDSSEYPLVIGIVVVAILVIIYLLVCC